MVISLVAALVGATLFGIAFGGDAVAYNIGQATVPFLLTGLVVGFVWSDLPRLPVWLVPLPTLLVGSFAAVFFSLVGSR
ncbi:hypothetical protein [Nocardioides sp.]|uniref:hypothetical protein n=1 Tax=Nocardioides sp. TaxID=35761 RepID=UPI002B77D821|nr:hypothetical protein [Nocardioides sp.]HXH81239.1 hypothetical protein [Nocardioides sp.]